MTKRMLMAALVLATSSAFATEPAPTVTLTQPELQAIIQAETTKALGNYIATQEEMKAKGAYSKVQSAFAPKTPPKPEAPAKTPDRK